MLLLLLSNLLFGVGRNARVKRWSMRERDLNEWFIELECVKAQLRALSHRPLG